MYTDISRRNSGYGSIVRGMPRAERRKPIAEQLSSIDTLIEEIAQRAFSVL
jgi:hypothetical protein